VIKVGITGQSGFIGSHLFNFLGIKENIQRVEFQDCFYEDESKLDAFVSSCDVIVHLAAVNRHDDVDELYKINISLVSDLTKALERTESYPHIIMSSSTQESIDNHYGKSKSEGRKLFIDWASKNNEAFTGLIIPNVFGPFGKPFYNSVIATFAYQLTHGQNPSINVDAEINLIYVHKLIQHIYKIIVEKIASEELIIEYQWKYKVSEILQQLNIFNNSYFGEGLFPKLDNKFLVSLFNTYRSFIESDYFPQKYKLHTDNRGSFVEITKTLNQGQFSFSTTKPGITRGNHFHLRKVERFSVIKGEALLQLRRIGADEVVEYKISGDNPAYIDIPVWYTHNIKNIGNKELYTLFWINEFFDEDDPDTYFEEV
jgi:UDP-2-acetamido-2,6-beta-L-arabino-hexul-4-ose reductase